LFQNGNTVSKVEGSWLEYCAWDGIKYWDLGKVDPVQLLKIANPLPSDCRFRTDLIELAKGNIDRSQE
jgi:hypothetical protein